jgi:hypothetical protein
MLPSRNGPAGSLCSTTSALGPLIRNVNCMNSDTNWDETAVIFLAMFWGGGGPYTIPDIIGVCDWVNRAIPSKNEMQAALNALLAMGLIEKKENRFLISKRQHAAFEAFRKRKRKDRFDAVRMYFQQLSAVADVPIMVELTDQEYKAHVNEYNRVFREAAKEL